MIVQQQAATPVDELQQRLFEVIGGEDPQDVIPLVEHQLMVAERELKGIPERAQERGPEFVKASEELMNAVLEQFRRYQVWLTDLKQALEDQNHNGYVHAHEEAQTLVPEFFQAMEKYSKFFASQGPYASPWSNTLARIASAITKGLVDEQIWEETLEGFEQAMTAKVGSVQVTALPGRTACAETYQEALETVRALQEAESLQEADLKPLLLELEESTMMGDKIERLMADGMEGPTPMPVANVIVAVSRKALAGEVEGSLAISFLEDYATMMDRYWEVFEKNVGRPTDSALVHQEIPKALEYGDQHDQAAEELTAALKAGNNAAAEVALNKLMDTARKLSESREVFETAAKHQTHAVCPACGRANPSENRRCEACGAVLPTEAGTGTSSTFNVLSGPALEETQELGMTENVAKLFNACDAVADGSISVEQFQAVVAEAMTGLKEFAKELDDIAEDMLDESEMTDEVKQVWQESHLPYVLEIGSHFAAGINDVEAGLASMLAYVQDPDREHLVEGIRTVWEGLNVIHRARLAMNSNVQMFQDLLQEARESGLVVDADLNAD